jgi:hypothetical protein
LARLLSLEKTTAALQGNFTKVLLTTAATSNAVEELKTMFTSYMGTRKGSEHGSPSVSKSVVENPVVNNIPTLEAASVLAGGNELGTNSLMQHESTPSIPEGQGMTVVQPKTASSEKPNLEEPIPATKKGASDGPSLKTKPIPLESDGEDVSESTAKEDEARPSTDDFEKEVDMGKDKGESKNVGGDVENQFSVRGEAGNVTVQDAGRTFDAAAGKGNPAPGTRKRPPRIASEVIHALAALPSSKSVDGGGGQDLHMSMCGRGRSKLVIFNVHGTLLDSSLQGEENPNSKIRPTVKTKTRRVVFRPWLLPFLSRCFMHFRVAFWGSKSAAYMDDVVPTMTGENAGAPQLSPLFVWCAKDSEPVEFEGAIPIAWGKPLSKVYEKWPQFSACNTLVIDNNMSRVSCNPSANVVISSAFYVAELRKLADDNNFLKSTLWPLLQTFHMSVDINEFRCRSLGIPFQEEKNRQDLFLPESAVDRVFLVEGEGTCEPYGSTLVTSSHLHMQAILIVRVRLCRRRWR